MRSVRGLELDGSTARMSVGRVRMDVISSAYGDGMQIEKVRDIGKQAIAGKTPGMYDTDEGSVKMRASVFRTQFIPLVPPGFGNLVVPVVFSYVHPEMGGDSDLIEGCVFHGIKAAVEASAKALEIELKITYDQIFWTDYRISINRLDTAAPLAPARL